MIENRAEYVRSWEDVEILPEALPALARAAASRYAIIMVTNQSAIGRGLITLETAREINRLLIREIEVAGGRIDAVYLCPHAPDQGCSCRKPAPGLILQAATEQSIDLEKSWIIGDALTDLAAGKAAGIPNRILVGTGRGTEQYNRPEAADVRPFAFFDSLAPALDHLL